VPARTAPPPADAPPKTVTVTARPLLLGATIDESVNVRMEWLYTVDGASGPITVEDFGGLADHHVTQLLGLLSGTTRKVRLTYLSRQEAHIVNGREKRTTSPVAGKEYLAEATDAGLRILDAKGADVSHAEGEVIAQQLRGLGQEEALERGLSGAGPMIVGRPVPALAEALQRDFARYFQGHVRFGATTVTPTGTRSVDGVECAVFAVAIQLGDELPDKTVGMDLRGEFLVRAAEGWPVRQELSGPVSIELRIKGVPVHGAGKARITATIGYP
jgi:hypothetical protein